MSTAEWRKANPDKVRAARNKWYAANSKKAIDKVLERRKALSAWFMDFKSTAKCSRCDENDPVCLDFHHEDPDEKEISISLAVANGWSVKRIQSEMDKCIILCSNCHRKEHSYGSVR